MGDKRNNVIIHRRCISTKENSLKGNVGKKRREEKRNITSSRS
jgi:hypothetical protein